MPTDPRATRRLLAIAGILAGSILAGTPARAQSCNTDAVLHQLDLASARFHSAEAHFDWKQVLAVLPDEPDVQTGTIYFDRSGGAVRMAAYVEQQNGKPAPKAVTYADGVLSLYEPNLNQETIFSAGTNRAQAESFLTLGFGGSGKDLAANWNATCMGTEQIDGVATTKLDLKPKQSSISNTFTHVTVWLDTARAISLKQVFYAPSGDSRITTYSQIQYNTALKPDVFKIKPKSGTQIIHR